ncbi:TAXI family TRAP transporter solute-binding subunit [Thalassobius sp. Cn5-15]|uniref:TAXI family TRAP transporter solute-binding subunit n=1 Tax=Thalassobius sp. Cn5-15 TaxID=2917763 RepID=UPI001EF2555C|nr:TAXI family TRAP transporter solute-binding subunit [Thalassobius sp. Cn5-15]MCG7493506.1 TAXI family TRAP transporter solute-binding subunit [Thalassobius sp. Cn5-15]
MFTKFTFSGVALAATLATTVVAADEFVSIGTGGVTGVYYPAGGAICRLVNKGRRNHGIRCSVESTGGSVYNINTIRQGELDFGVAQSDWQYHAYHGTSRFSDQGPFRDLRAVFSLHPEPFTVVARADAAIFRFDDLIGKRVNIGNPGSGQRGTMEVLMDALGWGMDSFALATELKASEQSAALCDNMIDAMVYTVGHPSGSIQEATSACDAVLIDVAGDEVERLIAENSFYRAATIPGGMYHGSNDDVQTFGVGATFVTSADVPEEAVYTVVKAVMENFADFRRLHPAFADLDPQTMAVAGLSVPLHEGAARYYREMGWLD